MIRKIGLLALIAFAFTSCKSDQKAIDDAEANMSAEEIYFQDYEASINKWGYIDTSGVKVITDKYDAARPFKNGLAIVNYQGKWGMIDRTDKPIIDFTYRSLYHFSEGLARFQNFEQKYGFINKDGDIVIPATFDDADDFSNGLAKVSVRGLYQFIGPDGEIAFESMFTKAGNFEKGLAKVLPFKLYGMIDTKGEEVIPTNFDQIYSTSDGIVRVKKNSLYGYYANGAERIPPSYEQATDFHNGIAAVKKEGKWTFIDTNGKKLGDLDYDQVEYGNEGFWMVNKSRFFGMINEEGIEVIPCEYKLLYKFKEGKCAYSVDGYWGFFDLNGDRVTEPVFALVWDYNNGYARALGREGLIILDEQANVEFIAPSIEMRDFEEGLAAIQYLD